MDANRGSGVQGACAGDRLDLSPFATSLKGGEDEGSQVLGGGVVTECDGASPHCKVELSFTKVGASPTPTWLSFTKIGVS